MLTTAGDPRHGQTKCGRILAVLRVPSPWRMANWKHRERYMSDSADWRSVIEAIIPHSSTSCVLLLAEGERWSLPRVSIDDFWAVDLGQICHELRRTLGLATTVLRLASKRSD